MSNTRGNTSSNPNKLGFRYSDELMTKMGFVAWCPRRYLLDRLEWERLDVRHCNPFLRTIPFVSQIFVVDKTEEVIRNLLETSQGDGK